jgi:adenosylhomocysteine nucleosidase
MQTIGLIAAMTQESAALLRRIRGWKRITLGPFRGHSFELSGQTCVLVTSGMGIRRASEAAQCLVEITPARLLISFGIAGAVETDLEIGDVVAAAAVSRLDQGIPGPRLPLSTLSEDAWQTVTRALAGRGARLYTGTAVTTSGSQVMQPLSGEMMHPILEMETAGIAQVAAEKGIPLLSLRSISDGPRAPIPINLDEMMDGDANLQVGRMLKAVVRHPGIILQSRQMLRNTRIAADNAAIALVAALDWLASTPVAWDSVKNPLKN